MLGETREHRDSASTRCARDGDGAGDQDKVMVGTDTHWQQSASGRDGERGRTGEE